MAQPKVEPPVKPTVDAMKQHMEEMGELAKPGPMNKVLADRAGEYTIKLQMWINADDRTQPPMESSGDASLRSVLGGRFLMHDETAALAGEKITSIKYWGFSKDTDKFEAMWSYTGGTSMMIFKGTSADQGKTVVYTSDMVIAGQKEKYEVTVKQISADSFSIELVGIMESGAKGVALLSTYTRKK
jgi:hypothetical protein